MLEQIGHSWATATFCLKAECSDLSWFSSWLKCQPLSCIMQSVWSILFCYSWETHNCFWFPLPPPAGRPCWVYRQNIFLNYTLHDPGSKPASFYFSYNLFKTKSNGSLEEQADTRFTWNKLRTRSESKTNQPMDISFFSWSRILHGLIECSNKNESKTIKFQGDLDKLAPFLAIDHVPHWDKCHSLIFHPSVGPTDLKVKLQKYTYDLNMTLEWLSCDSSPPSNHFQIFISPSTLSLVFIASTEILIPDFIF